MRRFLLRCFGFLVGVICLLGIAEYMARRCPNAYRIKDEWMQSQASSVETLVLGSSHAYAAIQPRCFSTSAFNLANSNQTQRYDWLLLAHDTTTLTLLHAIVYPASSLFMDYRLEETSEWYRCIYYQLYSRCPQHSWLSKYAWEVASLQTCCWKVQSLLVSGESDRMCDERGWCTYYEAQHWQRERLTAEQVDDRLQKYESRHELHGTEWYFDKLASYCQRHGIRLLLVGTPVSSAFRNHRDAQSYLENIDREARQQAARYGCIEYRNYTADSRFTDEDFFDVDHLNSRGAEKFTTILSQDFSL